jgi:hypothetical protein
MRLHVEQGNPACTVSKCRRSSATPGRWAAPAGGHIAYAWSYAQRAYRDRSSAAQQEQSPASTPDAAVWQLREGRRRLPHLAVPGPWQRPLQRACGRPRRRMGRLHSASTICEQAPSPLTEPFRWAFLPSHDGSIRNRYRRPQSLLRCHRLVGCLRPLRGVLGRAAPRESGGIKAGRAGARCRGVENQSRQ